MSYNDLTQPISAWLPNPAPLRASELGTEALPLQIVWYGICHRLVQLAALAVALLSLS